MHAVAGYVIVFVGAGVGGAMRHGGNVATSRLIGSVLPYGSFFDQRRRLARNGSAGWPLCPQV